MGLNEEKDGVGSPLNIAVVGAAYPESARRIFCKKNIRSPFIKKTIILAAMPTR